MVSVKEEEEWFAITGILYKDVVDEDKDNLCLGFVCFFAANIEKIEETIAVEIEDKAASKSIVGIPCII